MNNFKTILLSIELNSMQDVTGKLVDPYLVDLKPSQVLPKLGIEIKDEKRRNPWNCHWSFLIPSNEQGNGHHFLIGYTPLDGFQIRYIKNESLFPTLSKNEVYKFKAYDKHMTGMYGGHRAYHGHFLPRYVDVLDKMDLKTNYKKARSVKSKNFYIGLLLWKFLFRIHYKTNGSGMENCCYQYNETMSDFGIFKSGWESHQKNARDDFNYWVETGKSKRKKDAGRDWYMFHENGIGNYFIEISKQLSEMTGITIEESNNIINNLIPTKQFKYAFYLRLNDLI